MKEVRIFDYWGRISIPKNLRDKLKIEEGTPMEIYLDENNNLVLKKYKSDEKRKDD